MLTNPRRINVLGTDIQVFFRKEEDDQMLCDFDGYYDSSLNIIVVKIKEPDTYAVGDLENYQKKVLRHEIVHAFLHESGMDCCSASADPWATNEEMVDWMAIQSPKIFRVFQEQGLM